MLIPDKFEIGFSKEMVCGVIFGVFLECMCGRFGALMGPLMVGNGRYADPR